MRLIRKEPCPFAEMVASPSRSCLYALASHGSFGDGKQSLYAYRSDRGRQKVTDTSGCRLVGTDSRGLPIFEPEKIMGSIGDDGKTVTFGYGSRQTTMVDDVTIERIDLSRIVLHWTEESSATFGRRAFRVLTMDKPFWGPIAFSPTGSRIAVAGTSDRSRLFLTRREERPSDDAWVDLHKSDGSSLGVATPMSLCLLNDQTGLLVFRSQDYAYPPVPRPLARGDMGHDVLGPADQEFALCRVSLRTGEVRKLGEWNAESFKLWIGAVDKAGTFAVSDDKTIYFYRLAS